MLKRIIQTGLAILLGSVAMSAQTPLVIEGNGLFQSTNSTNLDIISIDDNTNSLMRFGDNSSLKVSMGYNGNNDYFNFSTAATLGADDLTVSLGGLVGINTAPQTHRFLINHNSSSGINGSAHLTIQENNTGDNSRLRFTNLGDDGYWELRSSAIPSFYQMDFYYTDGLNEAVFLSVDGDENSVGIHQTAPEGYLHLKQQFAGLDALAFVNDNNTDKWSFRIGDEDILIYFNGDIRGGFDVSTGNYNNFPPAPAVAAANKMEDIVLPQVMQLQPKKASLEKSGYPRLSFNPQEVGKVNPEWVVPGKDGQLGLDYLQLTTLAIKTIQEQEVVLREQLARIDELKARKAERIQRLDRMEKQLELLESKR